MNKQILALAICAVSVGFSTQTIAQANKNKKTKYYQNNPVEAEFDVKGFHVTPPKNEVDRKPVEEEYDVKIERNEEESKYRNERKVRRQEAQTEVEEVEEPKVKEKKKRYVDSYPTTYGSRRNYNENRNAYDKYYTGPVSTTTPPPPPLLNREEPVVKKVEKKVVKKVIREEKEVKMTPNEREYKTTVVKKRYTNLDVLCDDLDLAKIQRPVFKGICSECSRDVDAIIINQNMSSLEKNYNLKQCYMLRDKRLRETLEDNQYKKWLRIKDSDEYLIITKDLELKDGVNN